MKSVVGRARLIWGFPEIEFIVCGLVAGIAIAICCTTILDTYSKVAETEVLSLAVAAKVDTAESWASDGRLPRLNPAASSAQHPGKYAVPAPDEITDEGISFEFTPELSRLEGAVLTLRPAVSTSGSGALVWVCGNAPVPRGFDVVGRNRTDLPPDRLLLACRSHP